MLRVRLEGPHRVCWVGWRPASVRTVLEVLLDTGGGPDARSLAAACRDDAGLLLWTLATAWGKTPSGGEARPPDGYERLAETFVPQLSHYVTASEFSIREESEACEWEDRVVSQAARLSQPTLASLARLVDIEAARFWVTLAGLVRGFTTHSDNGTTVREPGRSAGDGQSALFPVWLIDRAAFRREIELQPTLAPVRSALMAIAEGAASEDRAGIASRTRDQLEEVAGLFAPSDPLAPLLPLVLHSLAQASQLRGDFERRIEAEKLSAMAALAYGAGHEINNPLANIASRAQTLLVDESDPERRRKLATINSQVFRAHEMIADLMLFAKPPRPVPREMDVGELVARVTGEFVELAREQGTELTWQAPEASDPQASMLVRADENQLAVAIRALIANALKSVARGGRVEVLVSTQGPAAPGRLPTVSIEVRDDGPGIAPEIRRHLFDPFFSGREAGRGLGLGLSKCWRIVTQHGGSVTVASEPGTTSLVIHLPQLTSLPETPVASAN